MKGVGATGVRKGSTVSDGSRLVRLPFLLIRWIFFSLPISVDQKKKTVFFFLSSFIFGFLSRQFKADPFIGWVLLI